MVARNRLKRSSTGHGKVPRDSWRLRIVGQDSRRVHFQIRRDGKLMADNPDFNKSELIELITEGNYDVVDAATHERRRIEERRELDQ